MRHRPLAGAPEALFTRTRSSQSGRPGASPGGAPHSRRAAGRVQRRRGRVHGRQLVRACEPAAPRGPYPARLAALTTPDARGSSSEMGGQRVRGVHMEDGRHRRVVRERVCLGTSDRGRPGGTEWSAAQRPKKRPGSRTLSTTPKLVLQPKRSHLNTTERLPPITGPRQRGRHDKRTRDSHHNTSRSEEGERA